MRLLRLAGAVALAASLFVMVSVAAGAANSNVCAGLSTALAHTVGTSGHAAVQAQYDANGCGQASPNNAPSQPTNTGTTNACGGLSIAYSHASDPGKSQIRNEMDALGCEPPASSASETPVDFRALICSGLWTGFPLAGPIGQEYLGMVIWNLGCGM